MYRVYITDSLKLHGEGKYLTKRWHEIMTPEKEPEKTAEEVLEEVLMKLKK